MTDHLAMAKEDLAIAESADAKREAYIRAAEHIAAHKEETGEQLATIAIIVGRSRGTVAKLLTWRREGYPEGTTPFTMADSAGGSTPTERAAQSHARTVLKDPEQRRQVIAALPPEQRAALAGTLRMLAGLYPNGAPANDPVLARITVAIAAGKDET